MKGRKKIALYFQFYSSYNVYEEIYLSYLNKQKNPTYKVVSLLITAVKGHAIKWDILYVLFSLILCLISNL